LKRVEYVEGSEATENFERGMRTLFKVPKDAVMRKKKRAKHPKTTSRKLKKPDKD